MSQPQGKQMTFQEFAGTLRNNIVLSYDSAKEVALRSFDQMTKKLDEQLQINQALAETKEKPLIEPKEDSKKRK